MIKRSISVQTILNNVLVAIIYIGFAQLGLMFAIHPTYVTPIWPLAGILLILMLRLGKHIWVGIVAGELFVALSLGLPLLTAFGTAFATMAEVVLAVYFLGRIPRMDRFYEVVRFILCISLISVPFSATIATLTFLSTDQITLTLSVGTWMRWWIGDVMGGLLVVPLVIAWSKPTNWVSSRFRLLEIVVFGLSVCTVTALVFGMVLNYVYVLFVWSLWAALRLGLRGVSATILVFSIMAIGATSLGAGPFAHENTIDSLVFLQSFLATITVTSLLVGALISERLQSERRLHLNADITTLVTHYTDSETLLNNIAHLVTCSFADLCIIDILVSNNVMRRVCVACVYDNYEVQIKELLRLPSTVDNGHEDYIASILHNGNPHVVSIRKNPLLKLLFANPEHEKIIKKLKIDSLLIVPLKARGRTLGTLILGITANRMQYAPEDIQMAQDIGRRTGRAMELQRLELQLQQAQKMDAIGRLAGGIAHDFNNLLTVIQGGTELAIETIEPESEAQIDLQQVSAAAERAKRLTQQLLAFARQQALTMEELNINIIVRGLLNMIKRLIPERIQISCSLADDLQFVYVDQSQIEQVVLNLVINARDAMPQGGDLVIKTFNVMLDDIFIREYFDLEPGPYVCIQIEDNGIGMDEYTRQMIFEPFFTTKPVNKGTGLGLSTCYGIVKQLNGQITVKSESGQGSVFSVYLPQVITNQEYELVPAMGDQPWVPATILLVEDDDYVRSMTARIMRSYGYRVLEAVDDDAGLLMLEQYTDIELVILDVVLPKSETSLLDRLVNQYPAVKILLVSGHTGKELFDDQHQHNEVLAYTTLITKPYTPATLLRHIKEILVH